jgi:molecular chaperone HtpG
LNTWIDAQKFNVQFENMSPQDPPMLITENEFMRRMKEQQALGGGANIFGNLRDSYQLIINTNHPAVHKMQGPEGDGLAKEALALAQLSKGLLKGSELTAFIQQAYTRINAN